MVRQCTDAVQRLRLQWTRGAGQSARGPSGRSRGLPRHVGVEAARPPGGPARAWRALAQDADAVSREVGGQGAWTALQRSMLWRASVWTGGSGAAGGHVSVRWSARLARLGSVRRWCSGPSGFCSSLRHQTLPASTLRGARPRAREYALGRVGDHSVAHLPQLLDAAALGMRRHGLPCPLCPLRATPSHCGRV